MKYHKPLEPKKPISFFDVIGVMTVLVMFVMKAVPLLGYTFAGTGWSLFYQVMFVIWLCATLFASPNWIFNMKSGFNYVILWLFYLLCLFLLFPNTQLGYYSLNLTFWEPLLIFYYYYTVRREPRLYNTILYVVLGAILISLLLSIYSVNANELAAREASSGHSTEDAMLTGNYTFTAAITVILPVMAAVIIINRFIKHRFICIIAAVMLVGTVVFIFRCNLMISILCMMIAFVFLVTANPKRTNTASRTLITIFVAAAIIIGFGLLAGLLARFFDWLGGAIGSYEIATKTTYIANFLRFGTMEGNLESRLDLCKIAINTFLKHPIFGIGPQNNADIYFMTQLGMHAQFFDEWARYGIVGITLLALPLKKYYSFCVQNISEGWMLKAFKAGFISYFVISMLNPAVSANIGITMFFVMPIICLDKAGDELSENLSDKQI